jgi:hypothetical protein
MVVLMYVSNQNKQYPFSECFTSSKLEFSGKALKSITCINISNTRVDFYVVHFRTCTKLHHSVQTYLFASRVVPEFNHTNTNYWYFVIY